MTKVFFSGLFLYFGVFGILWLMRLSLIYQFDPQHVPPDPTLLPELTEKTLRTADGNRLVVWVAKARDGRPTVVYFCGNAGNLGDRALRFRRLLSHGAGLVAMAYRGANGSTGSPNEQAITADAKLLLDSLADLTEQSDLGPVIYYGESLGAAVAAKLATTHPPDGMILESPFTSVPDLAAHALPVFPARLVLDERWETKTHIQSLETPLLVIHGTDDAVVPYTQGLAVFHLAKIDRKFLKTVPGGTHYNLWSVDVQKTIFGFLDRY